MSSKKLLTIDPAVSRFAAYPNADSPCGKEKHKESREIVTVALVDDELHDRMLTERILSQLPNFQWMGSYGSAEEGLATIPISTPHIVLLDIRLPGMSGFECARQLRKPLPELIIVMISGLNDPRTIHAAWECGGNRFLPKPFNAAQLLATLTFCVPRPSVEYAEHESRANGGRRDDLGGLPLTDRENEFMRLLAEGLPFKQIASQMGVGFWRVHNLQRQAYRKLGASCGIEAIRRWRQP